MHRHGAEKDWTERGDLVIGVDSRGNILDAQMNSPKVSNPEELQKVFEEACKQNDLYQL